MKRSRDEEMKRSRDEEMKRWRDGEMCECGCGYYTETMEFLNPSSSKVVLTP